MLYPCCHTCSHAHNHHAISSHILTSSLHSSLSPLLLRIARIELRLYTKEHKESQLTNPTLDIFWFFSSEMGVRHLYCKSTRDGLKWIWMSKTFSSQEEWRNADPSLQTNKSVNCLPSFFKTIDPSVNPPAVQWRRLVNLVSFSLLLLPARIDHLQLKRMSDRHHFLLCNDGDFAIFFSLFYFFLLFPFLVSWQICLECLSPRELVQNSPLQLWSRAEWERNDNRITVSENQLDGERERKR